jgi:hypothetical protein
MFTPYDLKLEERFIIEKQWEAFKSMTGISVIPEPLLITVKNAFFGAFGQCLSLVMLEIMNIPKEEREGKLTGLIDQVNDFFKDVVKDNFDERNN